MHSSAPHYESSQSLQQRLVEAFPRTPGQSIRAALSEAGHESYAAVDDELDATPSVRAGCLTKLLTNALLRRMAGEQRVSLDAPLLSFLDGPHTMSGSTVLTGMSLRHLMEHAHGLDASAIRTVPRDTRAFIDGTELFAQLSESRFASPGEVCSYGHAGAWIGALLLERVTRTRFADLLDRVLCEASPPQHSADICPAQGIGLTVRPEDLMAFLCAEMRAPEIQRVDSIRRRSGWSALDEGVYLGWSCHGSGWLGHNSILPRAPALVRIHPARRIALIVASNRTPPITVLARVLGNRFPELLRMQAPPRLEVNEVAALDVRSFEGVFANRGTRFELTASDARGLVVRAYERTAQDALPFATTTLALARENVLLAKPAHPLLPRYFQLLGAMHGSFRYLWDGESLFPRLGDVDAASGRAHS